MIGYSRLVRASRAARFLTDVSSMRAARFSESKGTRSAYFFAFNRARAARFSHSGPYASLIPGRTLFPPGRTLLSSGPHAFPPGPHASLIRAARIPPGPHATSFGRTALARRPYAFQPRVTACAGTTGRPTLWYKRPFEQLAVVLRALLARLSHRSKETACPD